MRVRGYFSEELDVCQPCSTLNAHEELHGFICLRAEFPCINECIIFPSKIKK